MNLRLPGLLLLLLVAPASGQATALQLSGSGGLHADLPAQAGGATITYYADFEVDQTRPAYLKVMHLSQNPVHALGWTTDVRLAGQAWASTTGESVELGVVEAARPHRVEIRVHIPDGALAESTHLQFSYVLAVRPPLNATGNGGVLHPSISLQPTLRVIASFPPTIAVAEGASVPTTELAVLAAAAALALGPLLRRRSRVAKLEAELARLKGRSDEIRARLDAARGQQSHEPHP